MNDWIRVVALCVIGAILLIAAIHAVIWCLAIAACVVAIYALSRPEPEFPFECDYYPQESDDHV